MLHCLRNFCDGKRASGYTYAFTCSVLNTRWTESIAQGPKGCVTNCRRTPYSEASRREDMQTWSRKVYVPFSTDINHVYYCPTSKSRSTSLRLSEQCRDALDDVIIMTPSSYVLCNCTTANLIDPRMDLRTRNERTVLI